MDVSDPTQVASKEAANESINHTAKDNGSAYETEKDNWKEGAQASSKAEESSAVGPNNVSSIDIVPIDAKRRAHNGATPQNTAATQFVALYISTDDDSQTGCFHYTAQPPE